VGPRADDVFRDRRRAIDLGGGRTAAVAMAAKGDQDGLRVEALRATEGTTTIFTATGRAPHRVFPGGSSADADRAGRRAPHRGGHGIERSVLGKLAELTGVELKEPQATAHVTGTWARPLGEIRVKAARVAMDPQRFKRPLPAMESLDVALTGDRSGLKLDHVFRQRRGPGRAGPGPLPVAEGGWDELRRSRSRSRGAARSCISKCRMRTWRPSRVSCRPISRRRDDCRRI
jgi:hypothetical protein